MKCPLFPDLLVFSLCLLATASGQEQGYGRSSFYASGSAQRDTGSSSGTASMPDASSPPSLLETFPSQPECPCIDSTSTLAHHSDCTITTTVDGLEQDGVMVDGVCKPTYQGANVCAAWDMVHDPACSSRKDPRTYCPRKWCYVDPKQCRSSKERYYKSDRFDLYYSYSTCRSIAQEWLEFKTIDATENRTLVVGVPRILWPLHYKEDSAGHVYEPNSPAVFDESIPWRGHLIDYFNSVVKYSNIKSIQYVHRSEGSKYKGLPNSYTQSVSDVEAGIIDLAISTYWVTTERLAMASFTTTVAQDEFRLWIPQPKFSADESFRENVRKILQPFSPGLWLCIVGTIVAFAILSTIVSPKHFRDFDPKATPWDKTKRRFSILTDSLNVSFLEFLGGGVDYRSSANMSQKCLNLGFAFTIFIGVTAYTANLAAFLTLSSTTSYLSSIEVAVAQGVPVCAPYNVKQELEAAYPMAKWVFSTENHLVLQSYDQGLCKAIVQGWVDVRPSPKFQEFMCSRNLVRVGDPVIQKLVAFPTRQEIVAGISHWIVDAETRGIFFDDAITKDPAMCNLEIQLTNHDEEEDSELQQLKPSNMLLPLVLFIFTCILALIFHAQRMVRLRSRAAVKPDALATTERLTTSDAPEDVLDADTEMDPTIENAEEAMKQLLIYHQTLLRRVKHTSQEGNKPPACSDDGSSQVG